MAKHTVILDRSYLLQNICRTILSNPSHTVDTATYVEDIDVFLREQSYDNIIVGENIYDEEAWNALVSRNPVIKKIRRIFINSTDRHPEDFILLKRPFSPSQILDLLGMSHPLNADEIIMRNAVTPQPNERRVFERNLIDTIVYFDDEFGHPITYMKAKDISLGGLFLEGNVPLQIGALAFLSFTLLDKRVSVTGQVVRRPTGGIGIQFLGLSSEAKETIEKALRA